MENLLSYIPVIFLSKMRGFEAKQKEKLIKAENLSLHTRPPNETCLPRMRIYYMTRITRCGI